MIDQDTLSVEATLASLRAVGEATRLRLVALLGQSELTVKDATAILGQSQPRISRHLKLLAEAGLILRFPEGSWVYYRLADGPAADFARDLVKRISATDPVLTADRERFQAIRKAKAEEAAAYFAAKAATWDTERSLHAADSDVEKALLRVLGERPFQSFLDLGTGTGRLLELLSDRYVSALGIDASHDMLSVARANLARIGLSNAQVRHGDIYALNVPPRSFDVVAIHQVLHFLDDPARALAEAARALRPGGRLLIIDFAPHELEFLRETHAHRRLGFGHDQMKRWLEALDLEMEQVTDLAPQSDENTNLTVTLWLARDPRIVTDLPVAEPTREVA
ncbi:ArsR/SmtB family transcription factor [Roseibium polysiphoniae]|uniref:Metalloregulator ArsR/SmtB family transcription factor n=1 Tax=Roseibium polysiphoniae TaxID=2571221 RepID=A0ABR9C8K8_9HYPH|nr:metalloregulator ArsR/SmtB family transcription factor [Roseibium polysiphoniae]MBD8876239.1 metalloregulator ArsR/SmtB family transcription factor [Roseibium polysiphoniae]